MNHATRTVGAEERMLFDLQGYLVLRGALASSEVAALLQALHEVEAAVLDDGAWRECLSSALREQALPTRMEDNHSTRMNGLLRQHPRFHQLVDHPAILPYLREFMGDPQLINTWSISKRQGTAPGGWHRGQGPGRYLASGGTIRSFMTNVVVCLTPNRADDGCLCVLPASHKSFFAEARGYEERGDPAVAHQLPVGTYQGLELPGSVPVLAESGDVIVFSESLIHNGVGKTSSGVRSNLYLNWLHRHATVAAYEPHNLRHFLVPPAIRATMSPGQQALTSWMELVHDPFACADAAEGSGDGDRALRVAALAPA